jgi:methionyl-tRNA formyltransferase
VYGEVSSRIYTEGSVLGSSPLRVGAGAGRGRAGELLADGSIACGDGSVLPMLVQSPGGKAMEWNVWMRGQRLQAGAVVESNFPAGPVS